MVTSNIDYLIIGQGLAGSILALTLLEHNQRICLITNPSKPSASTAAAGLVNPITGRRMSKTWMAEELFLFLTKYYLQQEQKLGKSFFYPKTIFRPFASLEEQNTWIAETAQPDIANFAKINETTISDAIHAPYGGMQIHQAGYLDTRSFLKAVQIYLTETIVYKEADFNYQNLQIFHDHVAYGDLKAKKILFCEGPQAISNPFFSWLPFRPVKGEVLHASIDDFSTDYIINQHLFVIPLPNGIYRIGATYDWRNLDWHPTEAGKGELLEKVSKLIHRPLHVLDHWAGIRPATADRRPLVGIHPVHKSVGFFGGMGSKGVSLIPYLAQHFTDSLVFEKEIMPEININRYISLYKK